MTQAMTDEKNTSPAEELAGAMEFFLKTRWKSIDRDNMEFEGRVSCYQLDRARAAIATYRSATPAVPAQSNGDAERERDEARQLVIEANNSLYGSQGYFHSLNGGAFDKYHLSRGIEELKSRARQLEAARKALEEAEAEARRYAGMYPRSSDGWNTFIILADRIASLKEIS